MEDIEVHLDHYATPAEIDAVQSIIDGAGIPGSVQGGYRKPQPGLAAGEGDEPEWIILIVVFAFGQFTKGFFSEAGADAWRELKGFVTQLRNSRRHPTGPEIPPSPPHLGAIHFEDGYRNRIQEGIYPGFPPDDYWQAWQQIAEPDWSRLGGWFVYWDGSRRTWAAFAPGTTVTTHVYWDRASAEWKKCEPTA